MKRRSILKLSALVAGAAAVPGSLLGEPVQRPVKRVLVVFKCHLDVGFSLTQAQVMRKYFDEYYPAALERTAQLRAAGGDRYIWTTGSWLLYEYLEQATPAQRSAMEAAIGRGDIAWHALPFTWQTEMLNRSMIEGGLSFSADLDRRFGRVTTGCKMSDVPGHSRGIIAPLQAHGVTLLDVGINAASTPPDVPDVFLWKDATGNSLIMLYHRHDYGSVLQIPGSDLAIDVEVRNDNSGPHTAEEVAAIYSKLRAQFPGAVVEAASLTDVAHAVEPFRSVLPVVTEEIGDTWIYGIPSDPFKVARYRELARLRQDWLAQKKFAAGDATDRQFLRRLLLAVEHTWGTDTKSYLDNNHYRPADLAKVIDTSPYKVMTTSWQEKRDDISESVASLPTSLREEADTRLKTLGAAVPSLDGLTVHDPAKPIETTHFDMSFDPTTGAIIGLRNRATKRQWAGPDHPLALFTYQTLSATDFTDFLDRYILVKSWWAPGDFGKPNIASFGARSQEWHPKLVRCLAGRQGSNVRIVLQMQMDDSAASATGNTAWPADIYLELLLPDAEPVIHLNLTTMRKTANRMPEAMWLTFNPPQAERRGWTLDKVGQKVAVTDVVRGGGRAMHALSDGLQFKEVSGGQSLRIDTLDAPVVALGDRTPLNFSLPLPTMATGVHFSLFNNAWGTNYPQWCGGDWSYRFTLHA
ncbi:DUF5054 domain-containing protein [Granulicella arctica]|uniref:DUF5054 domain-containing protein n=1 Tax=Granulicella arctica TaxID=940613 RepID=UPI0021E0CDA1|nr:DUF5054 domain-containing protein [Granulicella arctica]